MSPEQLIDRIEQAKTSASARAWLRPYAGTAGLSHAFFRRVAARLAEDPAAAKSLADHWRMFAEWGDDPAQAYRIKGVAERLRGRWAASIASFQEAGRRAQTPVDALAYRVAEIESLGRLGQTEDALRLARKIVAGLRSLGEEGLAARARLNAAAALLWVDDYRRATGWLEKAEAELERLGMEAEVAGTRMSLSTCRLHCGKLQDAVGLAQAARAFFERAGHRHMVALCDSNIAQCQLQMGQPDRALAGFLDLRERFATSPIDRTRTEEFLGYAFLKLNMPEEAALAFEEALASPAIRALPINRANGHLGLARAALASGNPAKARLAARQAAEAYGAFGNRLWQAVARLEEARALLAGGRTGPGHELAREAHAVLIAGKARFVLAEAEITLADAERRRGIDPAPRLQVAERRIVREGRLGLAWKVSYTRALALGPPHDLRHFRRMVDALVASRGLIASDAGKAAFLNDKAEALGHYLKRLLTRPNANRTQEALDVIRRTRAAALVDELLTASSHPESPELAHELERLRQLMSQTEGGQTPGERGHLSAMPQASIRPLVKRWLEVTWGLSRSSTASAPPASAKTLVIAAAGSEVFAIREGIARSIGSRRAWLEQLRWTRFELLAAQADRHTDPAPALQALSRLSQALAGMLPRAACSQVVAPDDLLWSLPWAGIAHAEGSAFEPILALGPGFGTAASQWRLPARPDVTVWAGAHPSLPHVERELDAVCTRFPQAHVLRTANEVRASLSSGRTDILHVAGHARAHPDRPMFSYLEFPDGRIHAIEIARSGLSASHVVLSACDTGSLSLMNRHEPQGMVRAFLARGAECALASLWTLDDEASAELMEAYYSHICVGENCVVAIHRARIHLRKHRPHPYFWAAMTLFGGYRT